MGGVMASWQAWALLSALFAALTAIFAKIGVENVNSDFATFLRTTVILVALAAILTGTGSWQSLGTISNRSIAFLVLSGLATGASWVCYFRALKIGNAAQVAPIDKLKASDAARTAAQAIRVCLSAAKILVGFMGVLLDFQ